MTSVRCWLCGCEVELLDINLMTSYERYLVLTFVLSVLIRFRQYQSDSMLLLLLNRLDRDF